MNYTTKTGDTFDIIAYNIFGNEKYASEIMAVNPEYIKTIVFDLGVNLKIPEIDTTQETTLPPWKV